MFLSQPQPQRRHCVCMACISSINLSIALKAVFSSSFGASSIHLLITESLSFWDPISSSFLPGSPLSSWALCSSAFGGCKENLIVLKCLQPLFELMIFIHHYVILLPSPSSNSLFLSSRSHALSSYPTIFFLSVSTPLLTSATKV